MSVHLTPELSATVQRFIATGHYKDEEEVLREALAALNQRDDDYAAIQEGIEDEAAGRIRPWEDVKAELRAKFNMAD